MYSKCKIWFVLHCSLAILHSYEAGRRMTRKDDPTVPLYYMCCTILAKQSQVPNNSLLRFPPHLRSSIIPHSTSMSLIPNQLMRPILILTLRRNSLTSINRRRQTTRAPLPTIGPIIVVILPLVKPKRRLARGRHALGSAPACPVQRVQTTRHGAHPGGADRHVVAVVGAGAAGFVAGIGRDVPVDAVAVG